MKKKILSLMMVTIVFISFCSQFSVAVSKTGTVYEDTISLTYRNVTVYAPAVAKTSDGYKGVMSTITVTVQSNGSGRVFVETLPLAQVDMQGSARLAVKVASTLIRRDKNCSVNPDNYDYFFVVRTSAPIIGGPSAGAIMTVATYSLLKNRGMDNRTVMTGMINPDGSVGPVGGLTHKIDAAASVGANRFLISKGQMTYKETIRETESKNGWVRTVVKTVEKNLSNYAEKNYGMEVLEVTTVSEAIEYFTGIKFSKDGGKGCIKPMLYNESMSFLSTEIQGEANNLYKNASVLFNKTKTEIPSSYYKSQDYRGQIEDNLKSAKDLLKDSKKLHSNKEYYSSLTKSFQSLIYSRFVYYGCNYFNKSEGERGSYITNLINETNSFFEKKSKIAKNAEINGLASLQTVGAAQKRVSRADGFINNAAESYENGYPLNSLYYLAQAKERSKSVKWWVNISYYYDDTTSINQSDIEDLALDYISDAQHAITYANLLLNEMGAGSKSMSYLSNNQGTGAKTLLENARNDKNKGYPAAALFEALEALVKANLAIEIAGIEEDELREDIIRSRIERAKENAKLSISSGWQQGIEPVLATSYYEYATTLLNEADNTSNGENRFDKLLNGLFYLHFSDMIAGALGFTNGETGSMSSRFVGIPEKKTQETGYELVGGEVIETASIFTIGVVSGLLIGLIIFYGVFKKREEEIRKKWTPRSYRYKKCSGEKEKDLPKSINDFYKNK
ncbi:MAG: S16 family serine protease [Candidatus Thermoplasmatota archaeon]